MTKSLGCLLGIAAILSMTGCGASNAVYPVEGRVTFEGKAMPAGGTIAFIPLDGGKKSAGGVIAPNGTYRLTTFKDGDGCLAGYYRVVVTQVVELPTHDSPPDGGPVVRIERSIVVSEDNRLPAVYSDHRQSPLTAIVGKAKSNEINFDLRKIADAVPAS